MKELESYRHHLLPASHVPWVVYAPTFVCRPNTNSISLSGLAAASRHAFWRCYSLPTLVDSFLRPFQQSDKVEGIDGIE